eukprot:m.15082 g.15082  ORF g.15082 m.15082 type:complete len:759 (+) comp26171_c0_seq1:20-2296(+)
MNSLFFLTISLVAGVRLIQGSLDAIWTSVSPNAQAEAVKDLIQRLIPERADEFQIEIDSSLAAKFKDAFEISWADNRVLVRGTTGVAAAWGFQHYLKYWCFCHVSWGGDQLNLPSPLPPVHSPVKITSPHRYRYYQNVVTSSYSFVWWNWTRWEREIDWMAVNGINLPLAFTGQEYIWQKVYTQLGFTQEDLDEHFGGPAFLAWARMGNIQGWGGPLPNPDWYQNQMALQLKILARMRQLGMIPVLPGFAGHVPQAIRRVFPNANVHNLTVWGKFPPDSSYCCTPLLEPDDPLFQKIGSLFIKTLISEFGTNHIYSADTFNEMTPPSNAPAYLAKSSQGVYQGMVGGDSEAVWLMQGWLFHNRPQFWKQPQIEALLTAVPRGRMLVLDLFAEVDPQWPVTHSFYGQPFLWCMVHNFGGNLGMYGRMESVVKGPLAALSDSNATIMGTGLTMEGIEQNDVIYELMNEMGWRNESLNISQWYKFQLVYLLDLAFYRVIDYGHRRYGGMKNDFIPYVWPLLARGVYNCSIDWEDHCNAIPIVRPSLHLKPVIWYNVTDVYDVWGAFVKASNFSNTTPFKYDSVDITRQGLQELAGYAYQQLMNAYYNKNLTAIQKFGSLLLSVLGDMDQVLLTDKHFLLGTWLNSAKALANNKQQAALYEYNARMQVTLWGPNGGLHDYANKMWGGLVKGFYKERWSLFIRQMQDAVSKEKPFNETQFDDDVFQLAKKWTEEQSEYPDQPQGNTFDVIQAIYHKYQPIFPH